MLSINYTRNWDKVQEQMFGYRAIFKKIEEGNYGIFGVTVKSQNKNLYNLLLDDKMKKDRFDGCFFCLTPFKSVKKFRVFGRIFLFSRDQVNSSKY